ncbi:MAG: glycosyltransferase, partial [Ideonella sp.]|nr:glycosyltransferase [Ideonella sp.]
MRILHLDPDDIDSPLSGGGPVRTFEICRRLARRHEVTVLTPTFPGSTPELVRDGVRYLRLGRKVGDHGSSHHITYLAALPRAVRAHRHDLLVED